MSGREAIAPAVLASQASRATRDARRAALAAAHDLDIHAGDRGCAIGQHLRDPDRVRSRWQRPDHRHPPCRNEAPSSRGQAEDALIGQIGGRLPGHSDRSRARHGAVSPSEDFDCLAKKKRGKKKKRPVEGRLRILLRLSTRLRELIARIGHRLADLVDLARKGLDLLACVRGLLLRRSCLVALIVKVGVKPERPDCKTPTGHDHQKEAGGNPPPRSAPERGEISLIPGRR